jgi:hypothetical protein
MDTEYVDIDNLLLVHSAALLELREEFLQYALTTKRADRPKLEEAIAGTYSCAGLKPPQVIWLSSPVEATVAAAFWVDVLNAQQTSAINAGIWDVTLCRRFEELLPGIDAEPPEYTGLVRTLERSKITSEGWLGPSDGIKEHLEPWVRTIEHPLLASEELEKILWLIGEFIIEQLAPIKDGIVSDLWLRPWNSVRESLVVNRDGWETLGNRLLSMSEEERVECFLSLEISNLARHTEQMHKSPIVDSFPIAIHHALKLLGIDTGNMPPILNAVQAGGWWWPFAEVCFACDNPVELHVDDRVRLHYEHGKAVRFEDGQGCWALHGVRVPEAVVQDRFTATDIDAQQNAQVRSVMIERFGLARYILESGAQELHRDAYGILYSKTLPGAGEPIVMVQVINRTPEPDGSFRTYMLRVPPHMQTAKEAVAWTFGLEEREYEPGQES